MKLLLLPVLAISALALASLKAYDFPEDGTFQSLVAAATEEKKPILLEFTGSDWCPPCKMLAKEVFSQDAFKKFAESDVLFVKLDFPRGIKQSDALKARNAALAEQFGVEGFPTVIMLDPEGKELDRFVGYRPGGVDAFLSWAKAAESKN